MEMGAEPGRRFLIQPAAKLEPVIVVFGFINNFQSMQKNKNKEYTPERESTSTVITIKQSSGGDVVTTRTNDVDANYWLKYLKL